MKKNEIFDKRKSPRAFSEKKITHAQLNILFDAARWAPSSMNEQPWNYIFAYRDDKGFNKFLECLVPFNQSWAKNSQLLILSIGKKFFERNNKPNKYFLHDVGAANSYLALQAANLGFQVHQMAGFDKQKTIETFNIDAQKYEPVTFIAVGYPAKIEDIDEKLKKSETAARTRKDISDFIRKI